MIKRTRCLLLAFFVPIFSASAFATTWVPQDFSCPIDGEKNTFMVVASYGSYIYSWPEKYQWVFWPRTDSQTFYSCKKCHLTLFMWDWEKLPKDKLPELKKLLAGVTVSKPFTKYTDLPTVERLEIMEKVYSVLGQDEDWWEGFYRLKGYHYGKIGESSKAADARKKSLELIQKHLKDGKGDAPKKLLLYISAAMKHFLGDDAAAVADLELMQATRYESKSEKPEAIKSADEGLNERAKDYIERIKSEKDKPRFFDKYRQDDH